MCYLVLTQTVNTIYGVIMNTVKEIIDRASPGSKTKLARQIGVSTSVLGNWCSRNKVPVKYWDHIIHAANDKGEAITYESMVKAMSDG
jgi:hypothetical protein